MAKFRDQLSALIADDKKDAATAVLAALDKQLSDYDTDIQTLKERLREKEGLKPEDFTAMETENKRLKKDLETATETVKTLTAERDTAITKATDSEKAIGDLLVDGGLSTALNGKLKEPLHLSALKMSLAKNFVIEKKDGKPVALAVIEKDGKKEKVDVGAFLEHWGSTDEGKSYLLDQGGSGGGAGGSGSGGAGATGNRARYQALNAKKPEELTSREKLELVTLADDPEATKQ